MARLLPLLACAAALVTSLALAGPAHASPQAERVDGLIEAAYDDYDFLEFESALEKLGEARQLAERHRLDSAFLLEIHLLTGIIHGASGDEAASIEAFRRALAVDPNAVIHEFYITPTLDELFERARAEGPWRDRPAPTPTPAPAPAPTPAPAASAELQHAAPPMARAGQPLRLEARLPVEAPAGRVVISYRVFGESGFRPVEMEVQADGITWRGEIPDRAIQRMHIDYYIQAFDRSGRAIAQVAGPSRPLNVPIMGAAERPEDAVGRDRDRRDRDRDRDRDRRGDEPSLADEVFHFTLGLGTGAGLATGDPRVYADQVNFNSGFAATPLHLYTEFGFSPRGSSFHVVPFLRLQTVFLDSSTEFLPLFGIKARYFLVDEMPVRISFDGGAGYGYVSHLVSLPIDGTTINDTTREGPIHIGGGPGLVFMFSEAMGMQANVYPMLLLGQFSFQLDLNVGLYFAF
ncbi:MAG: hypothetical protein EA398_17080 [Deltaproteobacteria bacterium]|nr:MAG: hypothetical protein EA398_17080 [Deltaproteobacteria bacterium]